MARNPLSIDEIHELSSLLRDVFSYLSDIKVKKPLAAKIMYPKVPSALSESLAIHFLRNNNLIPELQDYSFGFGGKLADILATKNQSVKKIEVKATAKSGFEYFGPKDIEADYILWLHFGDFFMNSDVQKIKVFIIKEPALHFQKPLKITANKLKAILNNQLIETELHLRVTTTR